MNSEDERAIMAVLVRYASAIDRRDWTLFATCFTEDVEADYGSITRCRGRNILVDYMARGHATIGPTLHRMSNFVIAGDGTRTTTLTCAIKNTGASPTGGTLTIQGLTLS